MRQMEKHYKQPLATLDATPSDGLRIRRVAGGCMVKYPPLFSVDGNLLFLIYERSIQAFSVTTGDLVRSYENTISDDYLIGMVFDRTQSKYIYGCTVSGMILSWKIDSGLLSERFEVVKNKFVAESFHVLYGPDGASSFLVFGKSTRRIFIQYCPHKHRVLEVVVPAIHKDNATHKTNMRDVEGPAENDNDENNVRILAAPGGQGLNYYAYIAKNRWYWVRLKPSVFVDSMPHCGGVEPLIVACHPTDAIVAVGDSIGRVVLYRNFLKKVKIVTETYHWHARPVKCVTFSSNGTHFYSGGHERVLVKWSVGEEEKVDIIPRLTDTIVHTAVGPENLKLVVCTADNSIQVLSALHKQTAIVQSFSKISADVPGKELFPAGLRVNPRTQVIIMNARVGCIQFYSTYTKSLLYTLDITMRNYNTNERRNLIHNTVVTNIGVNAHWLATVENWDDYRNSIETRLKFWKYDESRQIYTLSTNLENVHQGGVCDIAFSSAYRERDLQCATAGHDRQIKVWLLEMLETGTREKMLWVCVGSVQHRNLPVQSVSFSHDASLLAGGFGNVLCTWNAETLQLKCALSAPNGYDGCVNKALLVLPTIGATERSPDQPTKSLKQYDDARSKIETNHFLQDVTGTLMRQQPSGQTAAAHKEPNDIISDSHKTLLVQKVQMNNKMNIVQRAELFHALRIECSTNKEMRSRIQRKLLVCRGSFQTVHQRLQKTISNMKTNFRCRIIRKLRNFERRKVHSMFFGNGIAIVFPNCTKTKNKLVGKKNVLRKYTSEDCKSSKYPVKSFSQIRNVIFCNGQFSHLVVVCTENRLIVWNILSLKIQVSAALTIDYIAQDPLTNLIATFTKENELYVFLPSMPMPLYHRTEMPKVFGAVWIPRRYARTQSFNVDWQATSQLFFLNAKQELQHLVSDTDEELVGPADSDEEETLVGDECIKVSPKGLETPYAAMLAKQSVGSDVQRNTELFSSFSIGPAGRAGVRDIVLSSSHTMAPINLLCKDFLRSLLVTEENRLNDNNPHSEKRKLNVLTKTSAVAENDSDSSDGADNTVHDDVAAKVSLKKNPILLDEKVARKAAFAVIRQIQQSHAAASSAAEDIQFEKLLNEPISIMF